MNHVLASEFADQKIAALKAEAAAIRLARSARSVPTTRPRRHRSEFLAAVWASLHR
jgi:hypothetical protein